MAELQGGDAAGWVATTYPVRCSELQEGGLVVLHGRPCEIVEMSTANAGRHGHAEVHLVGLDVITKKKYEVIVGCNDDMDVPHVLREDYQLLNIEDGFLSLMDDDGNTKDDLKLPTDDLGKKIGDKFEACDFCKVTVMTVMDEARVVDVVESC